MGNRVKYIHNPVETLKVGTVGEPGARQFFIQVFSSLGRNTISIEKIHLQALVERLEELIRELRRQKLATVDDLNREFKKTSTDLDFPVEEDFQAGIMGITWLPELQKVSLEIQEISDQVEFSELVQIDDDTSDFDYPPDILQAILEIYQIRSFIKSAVQVIASGRAPCPFCGLPIDISGHLCPRSNGYKR